MVLLEQESKIEKQHQNGTSAIESVSMETVSDSERTDAEIDRIIAETNMLESKTFASPLTVPQSCNGSNDVSRLDFEDEDPETLAMRLKLIESLQSKITEKTVEKEREDGEVTDEDGSGTSRPTSQTRKQISSSSSSKSRKVAHVARKLSRSDRKNDADDRSRKRSSERTSSRTNHRRHSTQRSYLYEKKSSRSSTRAPVSGSHSDTQERRDRGASSSLRSSSSHRSKRQRDETQGKDTSSAKHVVSELSITLPSQSYTSPDFVVSTLNERRRNPVSERIVETSSSCAGGENRSYKRVLDSGDHLSVTVNTHRGNIPSGFSPSRTVSEVRPMENTVPSGNASYPHTSISATVMNQHAYNDFNNLLPHIPLPPTPVPLRPQAMSPMNDKDYVLLPPPPAPPVLPKPMSMVESCNPSSIKIQIREGGGRVAQLSTPVKPKDGAQCLQKPKSINVHCIPPNMEDRPFTSLSEKADNYEDVGMDVESSHSSYDSDSGHGNDEGASLRPRVISDADEKHLREMLLHQVILNRKRNAGSTGQSSCASIYDGHGNDGATNTKDGDEVEDVKNVPKQTTESIGQIQQQTPQSAPLTGSNDANQCNSSVPPRKKRKMNDSLETRADDYSVDSPAPSSMSELTNLLKDKQSQLGELDSEIAERMSCLDESLRRRIELKNQLAELEADIEAGRAQCRVLMRRRNVIRRAVERYEEHRLDRLLANEWDDEEVRRSQQSEPTTKSAESILRTPSTASWTDVHEDLPESDSNDEHKIRLKLLSRMRRGDTSSVNSGQDGNRDSPSAIAEEHCEQSTQTTASDEQDVLKERPLYRSSNFPQRLKRFVGITPDLSAEDGDCSYELKGEKCTDVSCESSHIRDGELTTTDVLGMMIQYLPGLVDSTDDDDRMRQIDALKSKRQPDERFGVFARRLLNEYALAQKSSDASQARLDSAVASVDVST
ncbi:hypothetical protein GCK32_005771 [Trichostrongylus colubriformis]|uniref:Putative zinc-finger domain-containing protein n=1 Tax=Trichostrongylus colubriformis TaxID=6319 RepID=A0AAN8EX83_TRICO